MRFSFGFKRYFKNTAWLYFQRFVGAIIAFFMGLYVAKYLGAERYGLLNYAMSFVFLFYPLAELIRQDIVIRELVRFKKKCFHIITQVFVLNMLGSVFMAGLICAIRYFFYSEDYLANMLIGVATIALALRVYAVMDWFFQSQVQSRYVVWVQTFSLLVSTVIKIVLIVVQAPVLAFAGVYVIDSMIVFALLVVAYVRMGEGRFQLLPFDFAYMKPLFLDSFPLLLSGVMIYFYTKIDQVMIQQMLGSAAVGYYALAAQFSESYYVVPLVLTASLYPALLNARHVDLSHYYERLGVFYTIIIWLGVFLSVAVFFIGPWFIDWFFKGQYGLSLGVLQIHVWAGLFVTIGIGAERWILMENLQIYSFYGKVMGAVSNVLLNLYLIPIWGINGAAVATVVSYALASFFYMALFPKTRSNFVAVCGSLNLFCALKQLKRMIVH